MLKKFSLVLAGLSLALWAGISSAEKDVDLSQVLGSFPGLTENDVSPTPVPGLFEVMLGGQIAYVTEDGKYVIQGDLREIATGANLTERRRDGARMELLSGVGDDQQITFTPAKTDVAHSITVFTDIDCGYCRKLHSEIDQLEALGVEVKYLFFPRAGPGSASWKKAESVWCADDRNEALTAAKAGQPVEPRACGDAAIAEQYDMGRKVGLRGTPAIVTSSGKLISGYLPAEQLVRSLAAAR